MNQKKSAKIKRPKPRTSQITQDFSKPIIAKKVVIEIESNGNRYLDIRDQNDNLFQLVIPYGLVEQFIDDAKVTTNHVESRNQKAWEAIQKIRCLESINLGSISECIKEVPLDISNDFKMLEDNLKPKEIKSKIRRIRLTRALKVDDTLGLDLNIQKGDIFETKSTSPDVVCVRLKNGKFISIMKKDFEEVN